MMRRLVGVWVIVLAAAAALAAERPESSLTKGIAEYRAGRYAEAVLAFDAVLHAQPKDGAALYYRGLAKAGLGQNAEAIADLEAAAASDPTLPTNENLAVLYLRTGRAADAKRLLQQSGATSPSAKLLRGMLAFDEGALDEADRYLTEAEGAADPAVRTKAAYYRGVVAARQARTDDARAAFAVAQSSPDADVAQKAKRYLEGPAVAAAPASGAKPRVEPAPYSLYASGGFEYDSNLVLADVPISERQQLPISSEKGDGRFVISLGGTYHVLQGPKLRWDVGYDFYQSLHFRVSELDLQGHTVRTGLEYGDGAIVGGIDGRYEFYLLQDRTYLQDLQGSPYVAFQEGSLGQAEVYYALRGRDYLGSPFNPARDAINHAVGLRQTFWLGSEDRVLDIGYQFDREDPESNKSGRDFDARNNQVDVGIIWTFPGIAVADLRYGYRNEDYLHANSRGTITVEQTPSGALIVRQEQRRDDINFVSFSVTREFAERWWARLGYIGRFDGSNIDVFSYDQHIVSAMVGVRY